jgi:hypothetical protein
MAVEKFYDAGVFYDGKNYTGQSNKLTLNRKVAMLDTSVFGVDTKVNSPGQDETSVSVSGWWYTSQAVGSQAPDPYLNTSFEAGLGAPLLLYPKNSDGGVAYMLPAVMSVYNTFGKFGELAPFNAEFNYALQGAAGDRVQTCRGYLGLPLVTSVSASVTGTYVQVPAVFASTDFLVLCVHLISTDATNVVFIVESDDNSGFTTPTTRITATLTATGQSYIDDVQGPIATDTYFRIKATRTGGTTFTAVAAFGKETPQGLGA